MNGLNKKAKIGTVIAVIALGLGFSVYFFEGEAQLETYDGPPRAVIIDQLYDDFPNDPFHTKATEYLETAGYTVDIVTTKDVTVDFYKNLPKMNYKYVVIRTHGAENTENVVLFTGERYTEDKYVQEQLFGQVQKAAPLLERAYHIAGDRSSDWIIVNDTFRYLVSSAKPVDNAKNEFFAISPKLVSHAMNGKFDDTIFLLGGCNTMSNPSLAKSLTDRGASMVIGWDDTVGSSDNDNVMLFFLKNTLVDNVELDTVFDDISNYYNSEYMAYPANLVYYPKS